MKYFVSRHQGAIKWALPLLGDVHVVAHMDSELLGLIKEGDEVYGTLPLHLVAEVCKKAKYFNLALDVAPYQRGMELEGEEYLACNPRFERYMVTKL
jgi:CRISPR-associated protein Csx16